MSVHSPFLQVQKRSIDWNWVNLLAIKQLFFEFVIPGKIAQSSRDVRAVHRLWFV